MFKQTLLFPFAAAVNLFSTTGLLVLAGLLGNSSLAAEIAVVQGAILAVFHSLSANARNLILASGSSKADEKYLFFFRLLIIVPAIIAVFFLANTVIEISTYLFAGLVLRKCCEWLAELQLANSELHGDYGFATRYVWVNTIGFVLLVSSLLFPSGYYGFLVALYVWAVLPAIQAASYLRIVFGLRQVKLNFSRLVPHVGSTTVIGVSTYIFRVMIVLLAGKSIAGQMFTAYAIGGVLSSLYVYALGPTLVLRREYQDHRLLTLIVMGCFTLGALLISTTFFWSTSLYSPLFIKAVGLSLVGSSVMIMAQRQRLYILQIYNKDVFIPDVLSNILLIGSIPFVYYLVGVEAMAFLFLWSAILAFLFFVPMSYRSGLK